MKTMSAATLAVLCMCLLSGCTRIADARLYPVQGPNANLTAPPVFVGKIKFQGPSYQGAVSLVLDNGESFNGPFVSARTQVGKDDALLQKVLTPVPGQTSVTSAWDAVYGQGTFVEAIRPSYTGIFMLGDLVGNRGTSVKVVILNAGASPLQGIAVDDKGNVYKVVL